jgi:hypothetical protein
MVIPVILSCSSARRPPPDIALPSCCFLMLVTHFCGKVGEPRLSSHYRPLHQLVPPIYSAQWPGPYIRKPGCIGRICQMLMIHYNLYTCLLYSIPTMPTNACWWPVLISFFASAVTPPP